MNTFTITSHDGVERHGFRWDCAEADSTQGLLHIVHGSLEHSLRYNDFAEEMARGGIRVYSSDIRGHGRTAGLVENLNYFADSNDGWRLVLKDLHQLNSRIRAENPTLPLFMLGHSMGSFLVRILANESSGELAGILLSGTGGGRIFLTHIARGLARVFMIFTGRRRQSPFLHNLLYGTLNKQIPNPKTESDFISRDPAVVQAYLDDPFCGQTVTSEYMFQFTTGLLEADAAFENTPFDLPILVFSGEDDPVAGPKKEAEELHRVVDRYRLAGVKDLTLRIYPEARHEMLNELNRHEVYSDVLTWMKERISLRGSAVN